jgi:hypothetical protein
MGMTVGEKVETAICRATMDLAVEQEEKLDAEIDRLDAMTKDDLNDLRRKRLEEMKNEHKRKTEKLSVGHGAYEEICGEKEFFAEAKKCEKMVVHFYRPSTWRCELMDKHLRSLAPKHWATRFVKINAEKSQYLCEKLHIWCLPSVVLIKNGKTEHTIVGLSELVAEGGGDDFHTETLEEVLAKFKVIEGFE